jgi:ADP-ribose pyrophosphatase
MTNILTDHQKQAISQYFILKNRYPNIFKQRKYRKIVFNKEIIEEYASKNNAVLGVATENSYVYFLVDLVEVLTENHEIIRFPYLRVLYRKQLNGAINTVVFGTIQNPDIGNIGDIVLINQERHATGNFHLELPRGFGEENLSGEENAIKELLEETGFIGKKAILLGSTYTDTGLTNAKVSFYHIPITDRIKATPESGEVMSKVCIKSKQELIDMVSKGKITDGFTIQALTLFNN